MKTRRWAPARIIAALLAPALIGLAPVAVGPAPAAHAAGCTGTGGVTVVVDHNQLGRGVQVACVGDGGGKIAWGTFEKAGFKQTPVVRFPQAVCRVNGLPGTSGMGATSCADMPPANAYWSLWWSDGKRGWVYSNLGAASLKVPDGGLVAWSWALKTQRGSKPRFSPTRKAAPVAPPSTSAPAPESPGDKGGDRGSDNDGDKGRDGTAPDADPSAPGDAETTPGAPGASPSAPSTKPGDPKKPGKAGKKSKQKQKGKKSPGADASAAPPAESSDSGPTTIEGTTTESDATDASEQSNTLPWWLVVAVLAGLAAAATGIAVQRRRSST